MRVCRSVTEGVVMMLVLVGSVRPVLGCCPSKAAGSLIRSLARLDHFKFHSRCSSLRRPTALLARHLPPGAPVPSPPAQHAQVIELHGLSPPGVGEDDAHQRLLVLTRRPPRNARHSSAADEAPRRAPTTAARHPARDTHQFVVQRALLVEPARP